MKSILVVLAAMLAATPAYSKRERVPEAADPAARVPALEYESTFAGYRPADDGKPAPWKEVNREVAGTGHGAHGTAAAPPEPAVKGPPPRPEPPSQPPKKQSH